MKIANFLHSLTRKNISSLLILYCLVNLTFSAEVDASNDLKRIDESLKVSQLETPTIIKGGLRSQGGLEANKRFETPVKIEDSHFEPGFETPTFIHTNEKSSGPQENIHAAPQINNQKIDLDTQLKSDMETFTSQLENTKDKSERTEIRKYLLT